MKRLMKSKTDVKLSGVCAGIANYLEMDPTIVRLLWVIISACTSIVPGIIIYIVFAMVMPEEDDIID